MDGILSFWEWSEPLVSKLTAALGLAGNPLSAVQSARNKKVDSLSGGLPVQIMMQASIWRPKLQFSKTSSLPLAADSGDNEPSWLAHTRELGDTHGC